MGGSNLLPYHCPEFKLDALLPPCKAKLAQIKTLRSKFPDAWLGPLEHCLGCKGEKLVVRELPAVATVKQDLTVQEEEKCMSNAQAEKINVQPTVEATPPRRPLDPIALRPITQKETQCQNLMN